MGERGREDVLLLVLHDRDEIAAGVTGDGGQPSELHHVINLTAVRPSTLSGMADETVRPHTGKWFE
jgi:hypothetical protein